MAATRWSARPNRVAGGIIAIHKTGFRGVALSFVDYAEEFPYFRDTVLPILGAHGIRRPPRSAEAAALTRSRHVTFG